MSISSSDSVRLRLRAALSRALKARDRVAVDAIRSTLSAIDNAEAVPVPSGAPRSVDGPIAGAARGVGAGDVARRALSADEIGAIVAAEIAEKRCASREYERLGQHTESARLRSQADLLEAELR